MNLTKNKGMYAESIFSRSCDYYREKHLAIIEKRMLPITIIKKINNQTIIGKLLAKSYVDYCGCYQGKHIEIEVKETNDKNLSLNIVQPHQLKYLKIVEQHHGLGFLLVYFSLYDKFYFVTNHCIQMWMEHNKTKTIPYEYIVNNCIHLPVIYPGIIDFLKYL